LYLGVVVGFFVAPPQTQFHSEGPTTNTQHNTTNNIEVRDHGGKIVINCTIKKRLERNRVTIIIILKGDDVPQMKKTNKSRAGTVTSS